MKIRVVLPPLTVMPCPAASRVTAWSSKIWLLRVMVWLLSAASKSMTPPGVASSTACRSEPAPVSLVLVTVVWAAAPVGSAHSAVAASSRRAVREGRVTRRGRG